MQKLIYENECGYLIHKVICVDEMQLSCLIDASTSLDDMDISYNFIQLVNQCMTKGIRG